MDDAGNGLRGLRPEASSELVAALLDQYGITSIRDVVDLGGSSNLNLLVDDGNNQYVARVYRRSVTSRRLRAIHRARRALNDHGVPCSETLPTSEGQPWAEIDHRLVEVEASFPATLR